MAGLDISDPFIAALLGGAVGGAIVALFESVLGRLNEHNKWLREERQRQFAEVAAAVEGIYRQQRAVVELWWASAPNGPSATEGADALTELRRREHVATRAAVLLALVASPGMVRQADRLVGESRTLSEWFDDRSDSRITEEDLRKAWTLEWEQIEDFVGAARRELGSGRDVRWSLLIWYRRLRYRVLSWRDRRRRRASTPPRDPSGT